MFQKIKKKYIYFGANLDPFCSNLVKNKFSWKRGFKYSNYLPSYEKSEKTN